MKEKVIKAQFKTAFTVDTREKIARKFLENDWRHGVKYGVMADEVLALIKEAGYKSPEEVAFFTADVAKAEGYVKLAEDQNLPQCPYDSLIFPTTVKEAGEFLTQKGLTDREKTAVSGAIARLGWENCQKAMVDEDCWRKVEQEVKDGS